jgi:DUF1009 family protein
MADSCAREDLLRWSSPVGIVAGNGQLPILVARELQKLGLEVFVVAHEGEADPELAKYASSISWVKVGELGKIIGLLKNRVKQVIFAGGIKRPKLFGGKLRLDMHALALIARLRTTRDDALLRGVAEELEAAGLEVRSASEIVRTVSTRAGLLTVRKLSQDELNDARIGWTAAKALGAVDVGQTVVSLDGTILAVEAIEGTDSAIVRAGELAGGKGGVVIKVCKPSQDSRLDLPTIGPRTIDVMRKAGMTALVLEAKMSVLLEEDEVISRANRAQISILMPASIDELC